MEISSPTISAGIGTSDAQKISSNDKATASPIEQTTNNLYTVSSEESGGHKSVIGVLREMAGKKRPEPTTLHPKVVDIEEGSGDKKVKKSYLQISTSDGYLVRFSAKDNEWTIAHPDGKTTRIWGDPHVNESDGDTWDFVKASTFVFGNNKITVDVKDRGNGTSITQAITIYNGEDRVTVSGIDENNPKLEAWKRDASTQDSLKNDGDIYDLLKQSNHETWTKRS